MNDPAPHAPGAADWIAILDLGPHPEGGHYRETYRSAETIAGEHLPGRYPGPRAVSSSIYYLLRGDEVSRLHRIRSDELWHFYAGDPLTVHAIDPQGRHRSLTLGPDPRRGQRFQQLVPAGWWFGASLDATAGRVGREQRYALVGCTVAPGFDFDDFELAEAEVLLARWPQHRELIEQLT